jgi:hypothetical protein
LEKRSPGQARPETGARTEDVGTFRPILFDPFRLTAALPLVAPHSTAKDRWTPNHACTCHDEAEPTRTTVSDVRHEGQQWGYGLSPGHERVDA